MIDRYEADSALRVAILRAEGNTFARAGPEGGGSRRDGHDRATRWLRHHEQATHEAIDRRRRRPALAGGMELTLCCDRSWPRAHLYSDGGSQAQPVAIGGGCFRLPRRLPWAMAMEMILTAQPKSALDMQRFGYVNSIVEPGAVLDEALRYAERIAANGPLAVLASKQIAWSATNEGWTDEQAGRARCLLSHRC